MSLESPDLDNRTFSDLMEEAKRQIRQHCPEWNDLSPNDPGIVLLESFAFLTETMIFRLNRIPEKAYIEFLRLIGVTLTPPSAARVKLHFTISKAQLHDIEIPKNTRLTTANNSSAIDAPVFTVAETTIIAAGETSVEAHAYHCDYIEAELIGKGSGISGLSLTVKHAPLIAPTSDKLALIVGVETHPDELKTHSAAIKHDDKVFRIWSEVENFTHHSEDKFTYMTDRYNGTINFAPSLKAVDEKGLSQASPKALAEIPPADCEIRVWYRYGGGSSGNIPARFVTVIKDSITGVAVINPEPATGGRDCESLQNALLRGPQDLHSLSRAVTARDFELLAIQSSGAVNRAKASTQADLWAHATAGTVEITLVPEINNKPEQLHNITASRLVAHHLDAVRDNIQNALETRRPLGTHCVVNWANYKKVSIKARVIIRQQEDGRQVTQRILNELYSNICPINLSSSIKSPWPFGQSLKAWDVYKIIGSEPAVVSVEAMKMIVDNVPEKQIEDICADSFQPDTWYTGSEEKVFRSTNNGHSWELVASFQNETVEFVKSFPVKSCSRINHAGLLAVVSKPDKQTSSIHISKDCGQTWITARKLQFPIEDFDWLDKQGQPYLILATEKGIFEFGLEDNAVPIPVLVDTSRPKLGFRAITVSAINGAETFIAVAGYENKGVYLSADGGKSNSFKNIGLSGELIEVLSVQHKGPHRYIWAGIAAPGSNLGKGAYRLTLSKSSINAEDWKLYAKNWQAGGCKSLTFYDSLVLAASYRLGVLRLNSNIRDASWERLNASDCGLPLRDVGQLETMDVVAADEKTIMAGCKSGVYRSSDAGLHYSKCSQHEFKDTVSIPSNWLLYSGDHEIEIIGEYEASRD